MRLSRPLAVVLCFAGVTAGCGGEEGIELFVDVRTDLRSGIEFTTVETTIVDGAGSRHGETKGAVTGEDYLGGARVAELSGLPPGGTSVGVRLLDRDGRPVIGRRTRVQLAQDTAITVLLTSDCVDVTCPAPGDAADLTECLGGRCLPPECVVESPEACPTPACATDIECPPAVPCAVGDCIDGACFFRPSDALCGEGEWCDPDTGCRVIEPGPPDGGAGDAGPCVPGAACVAGDACEVGTTECIEGRAVCNRSGLAPSGTPCRAAAGPCDAPETCTGTSAACPTDAFDSGGACRAAAGPCDVAESCDGSGPGCPTDGFRSGGVCRAVAGPCDREETCDGGRSGCPRDRFLSGDLCRGATGACDVAETCNGSSADCPGDGSVPDGTNCGATWSELGCGPHDVDRCVAGSCVHDPGFDGSNRPSCGRISSLCGFAPGNCCGNGDGYFCVGEAGNPIYGSARDCSQCCRPGRCCLAGNPAGPCT